MRRPRLEANRSGLRASRLLFPLCVTYSNHRRETTPGNQPPGSRSRPSRQLSLGADFAVPRATKSAPQRTSLSCPRESKLTEFVVTFSENSHIFLTHSVLLCSLGTDDRNHAQQIHQPSGRHPRSARRLCFFSRCASHASASVLFRARRGTEQARFILEARVGLRIHHTNHCPARLLLAFLQGLLQRLEDSTVRFGSRSPTSRLSRSSRRPSLPILRLALRRRAHDRRPLDAVRPVHAGSLERLAR